MSCNYYNISLDQGASFTMRIQVKDVNLNPINLSGYSVRSKVRSTYSSTGVLLDLTPSVYSYVSGLVDFSITASQAASLPINQLVYDTEIYNTGETDVIKVLKGYLEVWPEVSY
jgi:hypothetical protein